MIEPSEMLQGFGAMKAGFDMLRSAIGLAKDAQRALPHSHDVKAVEAALDASDNQLRIAEAQIAHALGYQLGKCEFPPTPMLLVGHQRSGTKVYECPKCHQDSSSPITFTRTRSIGGQREVVVSRSL